MKIIIFTHGVFLDTARVAAGNSVRAYYLAKGLVHHGHTVVHLFPRGLEKYSSDKTEQPEPGIRVISYNGRAELAQYIAQEKADVLLVGYWELLDELPDNLEIPLMLDVVAPRVLEAMFQSERDVGAEVQHTLQLYRKVDRFLVGTERQRHFLLPWLIMAGFDCRYTVPIDVVPISTVPGSPQTPKAADAPWRFVSGGVSWPWRRTEVWFDAVVHTLRSMPEKNGKFVLFAGKYVYSEGDGVPVAAGESQDGVDNVVQLHGLLGYGAMQRYLVEKCDIGIELADRNVEREYSQSFRAMEFLRAGLPLICNDYLEIAGLVTQYDAGWVVHSPDEIPALLRAIMADRADVERKSHNIIRLVQEHFHYAQTVRPVAAFATQAAKLHKAAPLLAPPPSLATPLAVVTQQPRSFVRRVLGYAKRKVLVALRHTALALRPPAGAQMEIAMVSRADVFPPDHGAAVKIDRTAAALSRLVSAVYLVTDDRYHYYVYRNGVAQRQNYPLWLSWLAPPRTWVRHRAQQKGIPASDAFLYAALFDWSYILRTLYLALRHPISVFQAEFPGYARACLWGRSLFGGKVALVEHNVEYLRLRDQFSDLPAAAFDYLRRVEVQLCNQSDAVVAVSERDREQLTMDGVERARVHYIPHGVDLTQFSGVAPLDVRAKYGIAPDALILVYHGTYMYPPNLEAMQVMAQRIMPMLSARGVQAKVLAIGRHPPAQPLHADIIFTGPIDHLAPYLLAADIAVVPLLKGGGTRMKILDYFAASLPVVSTSKGIEGIQVRNGVQALVTEDADEHFADAICALGKDRKTAAAMGAQGRSFVEQMDWSAIARRYLTLMQ